MAKNKTSGDSASACSETVLARYACEFTSIPLTEVREALRNTGALTFARRSA